MIRIVWDEEFLDCGRVDLIPNPTEKMWRKMKNECESVKLGVVPVVYPWKKNSLLSLTPLFRSTLPLPKTIVTM